MTLLALLVLLTSSPPDSGVPDARARWTNTGMWVGVGIGGAVWMLLYAMDRL